jgi:hypothetical protein
MELVVEIREEPGLKGKVEVSRQIGDCRALRTTTGWVPEYTFTRSIEDMVQKSGWGDGRLRWLH